MSRSTMALKRLGVPGLAAVTLVAGLPLFLGSASAAHITGLTIDPPSSTDNAGICVPYTVQIQFASAAQAVAETVDLTVTESTGSATTDVDFCTAPTGTQQPATPSDVQDTGAAGSEDHAEYRTDAAGKVTVGVISNGSAAGNTTFVIRAFYETTDNDVFNAGEFQDFSTQTVVGTTDGTNTTQDRARAVEVVDAGEPTPATATVTVAAGDDTDLAIETETRTYRVFVGSDAAGAANSRLAGVVVSYTVDSTVASATRPVATFGTTDNNGIATGTITYPARTEPTGSTETTDTVTFFVNQSGLTSTPGLNTTEPRDTLVTTVRQDVQQQNRTVSLTPLAEGSSTTFHSTSGDAAVNPANDRDRIFRAIVDAADGQPTTATTELAFSVAGGSGDETVVENVVGGTSECTTANFTAATGTDNNDSFCDVLVDDPTPVVGQTLTVTATVRGTSAADTATLTFRNRPQDARNIALAPKTSTVPTNSAQQLVATVTDVNGKPVPGVLVDFSETGAGAFRNGNSTAQSTTDANGRATAEVIALPNEFGNETVTATLNSATTECEQAANTGTDPRNNTVSATNPGTAGNCSDTATVTFTNAAPSSSATPTATTSPTQGTGSCATTPTLTVLDPTIIATGASRVRLNGPANRQFQVFAYSQPNTTYRVVREGSFDAAGSAITLTFTPPTNTRLFAQLVGCTTDRSQFSVVINVRTQLSLNVVRNGTRNYTFSGSAIPARPNGLIVSLYRVTASGQQILTAQTRANANAGQAGYDPTKRAGSYTIVRQFTGSGRFGFVVRTGQDLQNAPGSSNVRSLLVF